MSTLRAQTIRLAHENPALRTALLPLVAKAPKKLKGKKLDSLITETYYRFGNRVQVPMMKIPAIYREGQTAYEGADSHEDGVKALDEAMQKAIAKYRVN